MKSLFKILNEKNNYLISFLGKDDSEKVKNFDYYIEKFKYYGLHRDHSLA